MYIKEYQGYQIKPHKEHPKTYIVVTSGKGGKIPEALSGMFTDRRTAIERIDLYIASKPKKDTNNGETVDKS